MIRTMVVCLIMRQPKELVSLLNNRVMLPLFRFVAESDRLRMFEDYIR